MRLPNAVRTSAFRLTILYASVFGVSVLLLLTALSISTLAVLDRQTEETIEAEIRGLAEQYRQQGLARLRAVLDAHGGMDALSRGTFSEIGGAGARALGQVSRGMTGRGHIADVRLFLAPAGERTLTSSQVARLWRDRVGEIPGAEKLSFDFSTGHSGGAPVDVRLSHPELAVLEQAGRADPKDLPLLVCALREGCPVLVTFNVRDYQPGHPDVEVMRPGALVRRVRARLTSLPTG